MQSNDVYESYKGDIVNLYIVQQKTMKEVIAFLFDTHGFCASRKLLYMKMKQWGQRKNTNRNEVLSLFEKRESTQSTEAESLKLLQRRSLTLDRIRKYCERNRLPLPDHLLHSGSSQQAKEGMTEGALSLSPTLLLFASQWRTPEKLRHDVITHIKGSFESGSWVFQGNESLIESSISQSTERKSLHKFVGAFDQASIAFSEGNFELAGSHWRVGFGEIETLVRSRYHDAIPNMVQKINDLNLQGCRQVASCLKDYISHYTIVSGCRKDSQSSFLSGLQHLQLEHMLELEDTIMTCYAKLFELYVGPLCYNSFVTLNNAARRRLVRDDWTRLDECLPDLDWLERTFGPSDRRSLDTITLKLEIQHQRNQWQAVETDAIDLIGRAKGVEGDPWQRLYFLTTGWYFLGSAQFLLEKKEVALESLFEALDCEAKFSLVDDCDIFHPERVTISGYIKSLSEDIVSPEIWD